MPNYRFTVQGETLPADTVEQTFADSLTACREAVLLLGHILRENADALSLDGRLEVLVSDGNGAPLFELSLTAAQCEQAS